MKTIFLIFSTSYLITLYGCSGCSKSAQKQMLEHPVPSSDRREQLEHPVPSSDRREQRIVSTNGKIVIKMKKENGVYKIPVSLNGTEMDFIFDTGAGIISISDIEASFLYKQGKITKDDILGKEKFQDATGTISEGAIINLKEVSIGGRTIYNVRASVVDNVNAPLLLGQTALEKFGRITIDYENGEVIFQ